MIAEVSVPWKRIEDMLRYRNLDTHIIYKGYVDGKPNDIITAYLSEGVEPGTYSITVKRKNGVNRTPEFHIQFKKDRKKLVAFHRDHAVLSEIKGIRGNGNKTKLWRYDDEQPFAKALEESAKNITSVKEWHRKNILERVGASSYDVAKESKPIADYVKRLYDEITSQSSE